MLTKQHIANIRMFLARTQLHGSEVGAFVEIANALTEHEEELTRFEQQKAEKHNGKQNAPSASK